MRLRHLPLALALVVSAPAFAQALTTPRVSPPARVEQTVGLTTVAVTYHRPAVGGRALWGGLVPYDEVWRAGANENTVLETSDNLSFGDRMLPAGRYGLHVIPRASGSWTVIFSTMADAWGSYTYAESEDALRVEASPRSGRMEERLAYRFDTPDTEQATLVLAWGETELPVPFRVNTPDVVARRMQRELRGTAGFQPDGWTQLAQYALDNDMNAVDALGWADASLARRPTFAGQMTRATALERAGRGGEASPVRTAALAGATEAEVVAYAGARRRADRSAEASAALAAYVQANPQAWNAHVALAQTHAAAGDRAAAIRHYEQAIAAAPEAQRARLNDALARLRAGS